MVTDKQLLSEQLEAGPVIVTFTKKDGTTRVMPCTTNRTIVMFKTGGKIHEQSSNDSVAVVYDLESDGWRSFRWSSVTEIELV